MARWIIINFDGTRNGRDDSYPTNILKMHRALRSENQISMYFPGPGNEDENNWLTGFFGSVFGADCHAIVDDAFKALASVYRPGDKIMINGFSRGATNSRLLANRITKEGLNSHAPAVDLMCLFDTVAAFLPYGMLQQESLFGDLHISPNVKNVFHAVAIDEDRKPFIPNLVNHRPGVVEVWFPGNHCQIGGGYKDSGLSDYPLRWQMINAERAGLKFDAKLWADLCPDISAPIQRESGPYPRAPRRIGVMVDGKWSDIPAEIYEVL